MQEKRNALIHSHGIYLPDRIVTNAYFDELLGINVSSWLEENVEIFERRWCAENESTADLCVEAARKALENGNLQAKDIDLLIVATDTPEYISPSTSSKVQYITGMKNAATFDINTACAGFVTALDTGSKFIQADEQYGYVMVIGAYAMSKYLNKMDKKTANLFADGAGAFILRAEKGGDRGFLASTLITRGEYHDYMGIYGGGTAHPFDAEIMNSGEHLLKIKKKFPTELNPQMWSAMALDLCKKIDISVEEVKRFFLTQINVVSIRETMDLLNVPRERAQESMHYYGYTGSACIPLAYNDAIRDEMLQPGDIILMIGSGGGLAFAGAAFKL